MKVIVVRQLVVILHRLLFYHDRVLLKERCQRIQAYSAHVSHTVDLMMMLLSSLTANSRHS